MYGGWIKEIGSHYKPFQSYNKTKHDKICLTCLDTLYKLRILKHFNTLHNKHQFPTIKLCHELLSHKEVSQMGTNIPHKDRNYK